jgi:ATP-dependent Clp protease adaptor protein ClpS
LQIFNEPSSHFLLEQGVTLRGIAKATVSSRSGGTPSQATEATGAIGQAPTFRVLLLNDDFTPMEFVVHVLEQIFDKDRETATQIMLQTHHHGRGECGIYPCAVADAMVKEAEAFAREHGHPLRCVAEAVPSG